MINPTIKRIIETAIKEQATENYMFFGNLKQIKRQCELLLELQPDEVNELIKNGHDWADDHISVAKENMDQVFDFMMNEFNDDSYNDDDKLMEGKEKKNKPTNPKLWSQCLSWAKSRYKVCPSAYCNGAAAKRYKKLGGKWKKG
jgi:hypothetical protein